MQSHQSESPLYPKLFVADGAMLMSRSGADGEGAGIEVMDYEKGPLLYYSSVRVGVRRCCRHSIAHTVFFFQFHAPVKYVKCVGACFV